MINIYNKRKDKSCIYPLFIQKAITTPRRLDIEKCKKQGFLEYKVMVEDESKKAIVIKVGCNSRECPHCMKRKRRKYSRKLTNIVSQYENPRFLTISFKNEENLTSETLRRITKQFSKFREKLRKNKFKLHSYVGSLEIKYSPTTKWNIHFHLIYDGGYIDVFKARKYLEKVTKGKSFYVYMKGRNKYGNKVMNIKKSVQYICKYLSKDYGKNMPTTFQSDYLKETKNTRFIRTYGIGEYHHSKVTWRLMEIYYKSFNFQYDEWKYEIDTVMNTILSLNIKQYFIDLTLDENLALNGNIAS